MAWASEADLEDMTLAHLAKLGFAYLPGAALSLLELQPASTPRARETPAQSASGRVFAR